MKKVYADREKKSGRGSQKRTHERHRTCGHAIPIALDTYASLEAERYSRLSRLGPCNLKDGPDLGFVEVTDECHFGMVLFELLSPKVSKPVIIQVQRRNVERIVHVSLISALDKCRINIFRELTAPTMFLALAECLNKDGVHAYLHEYQLISNLINKIKEIPSVRNRWIPDCVSSLESVETVLNDTRYMKMSHPEIIGTTTYKIRPRTIGQWLVLNLTERIRLKNTRGVHLKTMLYAVGWITALAISLDFEKLAILLHDISVWIVQSTCDDCLYKSIRHLVGKKEFEYIYHIGDSFSQYVFIKKQLPVDIIIQECEQDDYSISGSGAEIRRVALRTTGSHSFLASAYAQRNVSVSVNIDPNLTPITLIMSMRQVNSLLSVYDLHARVLRAHDWNSSIRVFNAWFNERRIDFSTKANDLLEILLFDLYSMRNILPRIKSVTNYLVALLMKRELHREMLHAYTHRSDRSEDAHKFILRYTLYVAPSSVVEAYGDLLFKQYIAMTKEERAMEVSFIIENAKHSYSICQDDEKPELGDVLSETVDTFITGNQRSPKVRIQAIQSDEAVIERRILHPETNANDQDSEDSASISWGDAADDSAFHSFIDRLRSCSGQPVSLSSGPSTSTLINTNNFEMKTIDEESISSSSISSYKNLSVIDLSLPSFVAYREPAGDDDSSEGIVAQPFPPNIE